MRDGRDNGGEVPHERVVCAQAVADTAERFADLQDVATDGNVHARGHMIRPRYLTYNPPHRDKLPGADRPSLAGVIFLQIFLGAGLYRRVADRLIASLPIGLRPQRAG